MDVHRERGLKEQEQAPIKQPKRPLEGIMITRGSTGKPLNPLLESIHGVTARSNKMMPIPIPDYTG